MILVAALVIAPVVAPEVSVLPHGPYAGPTAAARFGLGAFFVTIAGVLLLINSRTGEQADALSVSPTGAEFRYPSGRVLRFDWRSGRPLNVRRYQLPGGTAGTRTAIHCGGPVRAFLTAEALDSLCASATASGASVRRWESSFPVRQSHVRISPADQS